MNPCIFFFFFWSLFAICFYFFFSLGVQLNIATDTWAVFFCSVQYCQKKKKSLLPHVLKNKQNKKRKENGGSEFLHRPFNGILVAQKLFRTEALSPSSFETDRSLKPWMIRLPFLCWRLHLTLHMKTVLFHCLWVTYTFHSIMRCNKNILVQKD